MECSFLGFRNNILTIVPSAITRRVCITVSLQSTSLLLVSPISAHGTSEIYWFYWLQNTRLYPRLRICASIGPIHLASQTHLRSITSLLFRRHVCIGFVLDALHFIECGGAFLLRSLNGRKGDRVNLSDVKLRRLSRIRPHWNRFEFYRSRGAA